MIIGIAKNPFATNVSKDLTRAAGELGLPVRLIDLPTLSMAISDGEFTIADRDGPILVESLAPYLLFGFPTAVHVIRALASTTKTQNPIDATLTADDKAATAERLCQEKVPQVPTKICAMEIDAALSAAHEFGFPVVLKRTHGAQGRWVRRANEMGSLSSGLEELKQEGPGALVVQPEIVECEGRSIRVVITGGRVLAVTERVADIADWRTNIAVGATQHRVELDEVELDITLKAARSVGLLHAGIDLLRTNSGPCILEVNACPDYTSMQPHYESDLSKAVLLASV